MACWHFKHRHSSQDFRVFFFFFSFGILLLHLGYPLLEELVLSSYFCSIGKFQLISVFGWNVECRATFNFSRKTKTSFYANLYHITFMSMTSFVCLDSFLLPLPILMEKHCIPIVGSLFLSLLMVSMLQFVTVRWMEVRNKLLPL